jgi:hypothetical protein
MGHSQTIHCIGEAENGHLWYAMNKLEIAQARIKAKKENEKIIQWYAQTKTGCRILGTDSIYTIVDDMALPKITGIIPCVCKNGCFICRGTKITTKKWINGFRDWQIELAKTEN